MSPGPRELVLRRSLSEEQAERREQVVRAAMDLADAGGYDAVVMKAVAERSGVAIATLYRWFASKDHLLTVVLLSWGGELSDALVADPPTDDHLVDRVTAALRRVLATAAARPRLAAAVTTAVLAVEPAVLEAQDDFHTMMGSWIDVALGDDHIPRREAVVQVLELVVFATIIGLVTGRDTLERAGEQIETAVRLLVP